MFSLLSRRPGFAFQIGSSLRMLISPAPTSSRGLVNLIVVQRGMMARRSVNGLALVLSKTLTSHSVASSIGVTGVSGVQVKTTCPPPVRVLEVWVMSVPPWQVEEPPAPPPRSPPPPPPHQPPPPPPPPADAVMPPGTPQCVPL